MLVRRARSPNFVSNDRPLVARYDGEWSFPIFSNPPETRFGGDFATPTDWNDPFIQRAVRQARQLGAVHASTPSAPRRSTTMPAPPTQAPRAKNWLGTDSSGRDMVARLLYGFRVSICSGSR